MPTAGVVGLAGLVVVGLAELDELEDVEEQGDAVVGRADELLEEALVGQLQVGPQLLQQLRHRAELAQGHLGEALCRRLPRLLPPGPLPPGPLPLLPASCPLPAAVQSPLHLAVFPQVLRVVLRVVDGRPLVVEMHVGIVHLLLAVRAVELHPHSQIRFSLRGKYNCHCGANTIVTLENILTLGNSVFNLEEVQLSLEERLSTIRTARRSATDWSLTG